VAQEQDAVSRAGDDEGAARQVAFADASIERLRMALDEIEDAFLVPGLARVGGGVSPKRIGERHETGF